ncbi:MAG TPA: SIMPL domain-containing protein [Acidimicrobiia bacterium]|nr:SIMPL domain-containing protein [Acidimicrobiia bacterium]
MKAGITVSGVGSAAAVPDRCVLTLGATTAARTVGEAMTSVNERVTAVLSALAEKGISGPDVRTSELTIWPDHDREGNQTGFRVRNIVRAEISDISSVGDVVAAATAAAGNMAEMQGIAFHLKDTGPVEAEARRLAWAAAQAKAENLASLAGVRLGAPVSIAESVESSGGPMPRAKMMAIAEAAPVEAGSSEVRVEVQVRFALAG